MRNLSKKAKTIIAGAAIAGLASAGGAYAYWTTTGNGTGSAATTAGTVNNLSFTQTAVNAMYPGDSSQTLTVAVKNTSTTEKAYVATVTGYITTDKTGCTGADFLLGGVNTGTSLAPTGLNWTPVDLAAGGSANATSTIQFNNTTGNQDVCKSAVVTVHYNAS